MESPTQVTRCQFLNWVEENEDGLLTDDDFEIDEEEEQE
jgi:hypothetical protein